MKPANRNPIRGVVTASFVAAWLKARARQEESEAVPEIVRTNRNSLRVLDRAMELAAAGREDEAARDDLRLEAGNIVKDILLAEANVRFSGWVGDEDVETRASRLLIAAATGEPVQKILPEEARWFEDVRRFRALPQDAAYEQLRRAVPELEGVEAQVRAAHGRDPTDHRTISWIDSLVAPVVGKKSQQKVPIARTVVAKNVVRRKMFRLLKDEEDPT